VIFGGVGQNPQVDALRRGVDVLIATPGRLLDLINQRYCELSHVEVLVLDEADRMLDMGFIRDIRKIVAELPKKRQTMLFSATMPAEIRQLADSMLHHPAVVQVTPVASTVETIDQSVYFVEKRNKPQLLAHLVEELPMTRAIVFTRTKHGADKVVRHLHKRGIKAEAIHGNKSQNNRTRAMANFKAGKVPVLVATDIAARGIDIDDVTHVVNYDLTHEPETYVHRIGRTARAGASGTAIAFCDREERANLAAIEKLIRRKITVREDQPEYEETPVMTAAAPVTHVNHAGHVTHAAHATHAGHSAHPHRGRAGGVPQRATHVAHSAAPQPRHSAATAKANSHRREAGQHSSSPRGGQRSSHHTSASQRPHYAGKVKRGGRQRGF